MQRTPEAECNDWETSNLGIAVITGRLATLSNLGRPNLGRRNCETPTKLKAPTMVTLGRAKTPEWVLTLSRHVRLISFQREKSKEVLARECDESFG